MDKNALVSARTCAKFDVPAFMWYRFSTTRLTAQGECEWKRSA